jgi:transposase
MTSMTRTTVGVTGGVDTHGQSHHAAVIDRLGRQLGDREFPVSPAGYGALMARRAHGKSDPLDAHSAARAALSGAASVVPKPRPRIK